MAVDIVLVLRSEHRRIRQEVDRCGRSSRGFADPAAELQLTLRAHMLAATAEVYPTAAKLSDPSTWPAETLTSVRTTVEQDDPDDGTLKQAATDLMQAEATSVLPVLEQRLEIPARRRMGKVFRIRRDANARTAAAGQRRRHRSQTELYELARRAGVEHRSHMTQAELEAAVEGRGGEA